MRDIIESALKEAERALQNLRANEQALAAIERAATLISDSFVAGGKVISCGNGGSHCDAMHFAEELTGRYRENRRALPALAISDPSHISCTGNDYGFDHIFSRFIEAHGKAGDVLLGISTSGKSKNIIAAANAARALGMHVIILSGKPQSPLSTLASVEICTPGGSYADRVQELHIKVIHILIELIEKRVLA